MISINDIIKRSRYLNSSNHEQEYKQYHSKSKLFQESNVYRFEDKKFLLNHWESLDENQLECFKKTIDILDEAYENDNKNEFNYVKSYIINEVTPVVRDAKQTARYLKYKTTRMKNKVADNVKKNVEDMKAVGGKVVNKVKETNKQAADTVKNNVKKSLGQKDLHEAYIEILDSLTNYNHCDRILENSYTIQKRFNIMHMIESTDIKDDAKLITLVDSICECVNTYDADLSTRINTVLETCFYFLSKENKNFNKRLVLEETVNNFIAGNLEDNDLYSIRSIIEDSVIFSNEDKECVNFIYTGTPYDESTYNDNIENEEAVNIVSTEAFVTDVFDEDFIPAAKKTVKDIVNDYKLAKMKKSTDVRTCVSKMFTKSPTQIIEGLPNFLSWVRLSYIVGATAIHPAVGAVTLVVDQFIAMKLKRRDVNKMITVFKNERKIVKEKLEKVVDDRDKKNLKEYDKYLSNGLEKLEDYSDSLLSNYEKHVKDTGEEYDKDKEFEYDNDDFDDDTEYSLESNTFEKFVDTSNNFSKQYFTENIANNIKLMDEDTIDTITEVACRYPVIIDNTSLYTILKEEYDDIKENKKWTRMSCLNANIRKLDECSEIVTSIDSDIDVFEIMNGLEDLFTEYSINKSLNVTNESVSATAKALSNKLRKIMQKASDMDKEASRKIDSSVNMFVTSMQRANRNENREAIIRGSILPSASKVVKAAILDGGVALINPAIAIILAVGQLACRKKMQAKERQLVLDEIDIELEMCKRYLRQAEDQNDLEAQKRILQIQRNLERQKQRIQYKMKIYWNQDVPNIKKDDEY